MGSQVPSKTLLWTRATCTPTVATPALHVSELLYSRKSPEFLYFDSIYPFRGFVDGSLAFTFPKIR